MTKTNIGQDMQAAALGGDVVGFTGTATATSATSLTATATPFVASAYIGHIVFAGSVYGVITANTTSVLTVDQWSNPATPGGAAGSTPSGTTVYTISPGAAPAIFTALSASAVVGVTATNLSGEITTAGGGLIKKQSTYAHTTSANTYTLTTVFTANGSDALPVTVAKIGVFNSNVATTGRILFETAVSPTATLSAPSDALTLTHTITM
jgi:hypothetical protein